MTHVAFPEVFDRLERGELDGATAKAAFGAILAGAWTSTQIGAFAAGLRLRGETAEIIVAAAEALRAVMTAVDHALDPVLDTCGTGGDGAHTLNVSTAAAIVTTACGAYVAKHGNRSVSSQCGSADVVAALGVPIDLDPTKQAAVLAEARIAFLMAPVHHPALKNAATARRELGIRTIFNAVGPLANPARATHQLVGVYDDALRPIVAAALGRLGVKQAWVVRSTDGLDEISPAAPSRVTVLRGGEIREITVSPADFGVEAGSLDGLHGGDAASNAAAIVRILEGREHPASVSVALNAAAALHVLEGIGLDEAYARAAEAIANGSALAVLERWRAVATRARATEP